MKGKRNRYREDAYTRRARTVITIVVSCVVVAAVCIGGFLTAPHLVKFLTGTSSESSQSPSPVKPVSSAPAPGGSASTTSSAQGATSVKIDTTGLSGYQAKFPDLYAKTPVGNFVEAQDKVIYLTFDDGPSTLTRPLLDVLEKNNVQATFFLCDQAGMDEYMPLIKEIYQQGSTCAVHSYSHDYQKIYSSVDAFLEDFEKMYKIINDQTGGHAAHIFRFPGGSNAGPDKAIREQLLPEMLRRGFLYYDWDADSQDASAAAHDANAIYQNVVSGMANGAHVFLMHNTGAKKATLEAVAKIIAYGKANGYTFKAMPENLDPFYYCFTNKIMIPALKNNAFFKPSDVMKAKYPDLFSNSPSGASSTAAASSETSGDES